MRLRSVIFLLLSLACARPAPAAQEDRTLLQKRQEEMRRSAEQNLKGIREIPGTFRMSDVCQLAPDKGGWKMSTNIPASARNGTVRLKVEGKEGLCILSVSGGQKATPDVLSFSHSDFSSAQAVQITTQITWTYGSLSIGRYAQLLDGYRNVTLYQGDPLGIQRATRRPSRPGVQFIINSADNRGQARTNLVLTAPDFLTLRRQHGREVDEYLRPLLRELRLEAVLAADPLMAWQVFAEDLKPDPAIVAKLRELLPDLDSDSFKRRTEALERLQQLGSGVALAIIHADRAGLSPQQNVLLDAALAPFQPSRITDAERLKGDINFLVDCLYLEDSAIRDAALTYLSRKLGRTVEFKAGKDPAAHSEAVDALRSQLPALEGR